MNISRIITLTIASLALSFPGISFAVDHQKVWSGVDTLTSTLNGVGIMDVVVSSDGKYQAIANYDYVIVGGPSDKNSTVFYSKQPNGTITMKGGYVYSSDYGATWTRPALPFDMGAFGMAFSQDGKYQTITGQRYFADIIMTEYYPGVWRKDVIVRTDEKFILVSSNYGATWTKTVVTNTAPSSAFEVEMSNDGKYQTVTVAGAGALYTSSNYGVTWVRRTFGGSQEAPNLAVSASGQYQTVISYGYPSNGAIYTSSNYGATWTLRKTFTAQSDNVSRKSLGMIDSGATQFYTDYSSRIFKSTDYGVTWTNIYTFPTGSFGNFAISSKDAEYQIFVSNSSSAVGFYTSSDYGATWIKKDLYRAPYYTLKAAISDDGKYALASGTDTSIYGWASSYANILVGDINVSSNIAGSWSITGRANATGSGVSQSYASQPIGTYTITWSSVPGYKTPPTQSQTLTEGATVTFSGDYIPEQGSIEVNANIPQAAWSLSSGNVGHVYAWGTNTYGQLGDNTTINRLIPTAVHGVDDVDFLANIIKISGGTNSAYALASNGASYAWGSNNYGQLGDGTSANNRYTPVKTSLPNDFIEISGVGSTAFGLKSNGTVWSWGANAGMCEGTTSRAVPAQVTTISGVKQIATAGGYSVYMLKLDGTVWGCGRNAQGQLGDGTTTLRQSPVRALNLSGVIQIAGGDNAGYALKSDGTVWSWGYNNGGSLGDGTSTIRLTPVQALNLSGVVQIAAGSSNGYALKSDGTVWSWGSNGAGQLGDSAASAYGRPAPVQIPGLSNVTQIASYYASAFAIKSDGTLWAWGKNTGGELGDGTMINRFSPVQIVGISNVQQVKGQSYASLAITGGIKTTLTGSGVSGNYSGKPTGAYTITWADVPGYTTPSSASQVLTDSGTISFVGNYVATTCTTANTAWSGVCNPILSCSSLGSGGVITDGTEQGICPDGSDQTPRTCTLASPIVCPGITPPSTTCGDNVCGAGESLLTCPKDCKGQVQQF